ncbi:MAG: hypothetical protein D6832_00670 [Alphaproteobacteria bacterium]|nr:MAG: hypothetical protein D6832_00670 [Alphaproteobacteria bacterium]
MRRLVLLLALLAAACDSPHPRFAGRPVVEVTVEGDRFRVHLGEGEAQALRINRRWGAQDEEVVRRARIAIARASGCRVTRAVGDRNIVSAALDCPGG